MPLCRNTPSGASRESHTPSCTQSTGPLAESTHTKHHRDHQTIQVLKPSRIFPTHILELQRLLAHILAKRVAVRMQTLDSDAIAAAQRQVVQPLDVRHRFEARKHRAVVGHLGAGKAESPRDLRSSPVVAGLHELVLGSDFVIEPRYGQHRLQAARVRILQRDARD